MLDVIRLKIYREFKGRLSFLVGLLVFSVDSFTPAFEGSRAL